MNVLFVNDEVPATEHLVSVLGAFSGWSMNIVHGAADALFALDDRVHQLVLLFWPRDGMQWEGAGLCRAICSKAPHVGVIVLSSTTMLENKLSAFEAGADDYVATSCEPAELVARARAVARRSTAASAAPGALWRALVPDPHTGEINGPAGRIELTPTERHLLALLAVQGEEGLSTEALALELLSRNDVHARNLVHRHLSNLRKKLQQAGIRDVVGRSRSGYLLRAQRRSA